MTQSDRSRGRGTVSHPVRPLAADVAGHIDGPAADSDMNQGAPRSITLPPPRAAAARSTIMYKAAMAVTGLIMVLYLLVHMYGNLKVFAGKKAFDDYAHHLRELGEPILPHTGALWTIRVVLLASVLIHIYAAFKLWYRANRATVRHRGRRYQSRHNRQGVQRTYSSFTLRWGGVVIALFVVYHLLHLTWNLIHPGGASTSPYDRVISGFQVWWVTLSYTVALLAVGFHLRHGIWSALANLGRNTSVRRRRHLNLLAIAVASVITVGFLVPPFTILFGWVG
jgi:succinate dehydrogenase / fumarate reductase, cytochrome b subunit